MKLPQTCGKTTFGKKLRPVYQSATTFGGEKFDFLGPVTVDLEISCCLLQQDVLVVRNMQQPVILGWDALLKPVLQPTVIVALVNWKIMEKS